METTRPESVRQDLLALLPGLRRLAGRLLRDGGYDFDVVHTSLLKRAIRTMWLALDEMDRFIIQTALERNDFNVMATARALGTTRETLRYRIQKYGLGTDNRS